MALLVETLVAGLLAVTIGYCVILNRRLKAMHADEAGLRRTVAELTAASETATHAVAGLKHTLAAEEAALARRLDDAREVAAALDGAVADGAELMRRLRLIIEAGRPGAAEPVASEMPATRRAPAPPEPANLSARGDEGERAA
jgi:hypothetical protein